MQILVLLNSQLYHKLHRNSHLQGLTSVQNKVDTSLAESTQCDNTIAVHRPGSLHRSSHRSTNQSISKLFINTNPNFKRRNTIIWFQFLKEVNWNSLLIVQSMLVLVLDNCLLYRRGIWSPLCILKPERIQEFCTF